jgi:GDP-L-fucose synthase
MEKNSKIFVAGHKGLVGSALVRQLTLEGYTNIVTYDKKGLDLRKQLQVQSFFQTEKIDYVFLAAAKVGGIKFNAEAPAEFMYDNLMIQSNVIDAAYRNGVKKLMFLGSACIYPKVVPQPIKEEYMMTGPLEPTNEGYAIAKIAGLKMAEYYKEQYNFNAISVMPANLYGVNDNFDPDRGHVIPGLINRFLEAKKNKNPSITCWGDGSPTREFLYCDDMADACIFLMKNYNDSKFINIGSDTELTIKDLAEKIKVHTGYEGTIEWDINKPNGTPKRKLDNSKLFNMGWKPKVSFDEGLKKTIDWYLKVEKEY